MKRKLFIRVLLTGLVLLPICGTAGGQTRAMTPKMGDPNRRAIMDALRVPVEKELKQKVIFVVSHLKLQNNWAFLEGRPQQPNGKPINFRKTRYQEAVKEGMFDDGFSALLHKTNSKWRVVTYNIGATDVVWEPWNHEYHAPDAIFPFTRDDKGETHRH